MMLKKIPNKGFTLLEVLVSLVILSIIILTFSSIFVFSTRTAVSNNDDLVAVNLAKATLEKIEHDPYKYINDPNTGSVNYETDPVTFDKNNCPANNSACQSLFSQISNNKTFSISVTASQKSTTGDKNLKLINVVVEVKLDNSKPIISSKTEGYVEYE